MLKLPTAIITLMQPFPTIISKTNLAQSPTVVNWLDFDHRSTDRDGRVTGNGI